jgi:hypothetical protein
MNFNAGVVLFIFFCLYGAVKLSPIKGKKLGDVVGGLFLPLAMVYCFYNQYILGIVMIVSIETIAVIYAKWGTKSNPIILISGLIVGLQFFGVNYFFYFSIQYLR